MTLVCPLEDLPSELEAIVADKDDPEAWYVLFGNHISDYSVWADHELEDYPEQEEMHSDERDANPPVEGAVQIGTIGWNSDLFADDGGPFVKAYSFGDTIDAHLLGTIVVHESLLDTETLTELKADAQEVEAE